MVATTRKLSDIAKSGSPPVTGADYYVGVSSGNTDFLYPVGTFGKIIQTLAFANVGNAVNGSANEFGHWLTATAAVTNSLASYEKIGVFSDVYSADPSQYGPDILRDAVGVDTRGTILAGNMLGRVWGINVETRIQIGADGFSTGMEILVGNSGSDQAALDTTTSKYGINLIAGGVQDATSGIYLIGDGGKFHQGLVAKANSIVNYFLRFLPNLFSVDVNGNLVAGGGTFQTGANSNLLLTNDGTGNLVSLNAGTFVTGIGMSGGYPGDGNLYLTSQLGLQFWSSNAKVWEVDFAGNMILHMATLINAVNDAGAQAAGAVVGQVYRNGSVLMVRVV